MALASTHHSIHGPTARQINKEARDTLALLAEGKALCTPNYKRISDKLKHIDLDNALDQELYF